MRIKCLSLTQPFASLVALNAKKIETRSWNTAHRGPLAIHAAKGFPRKYRELCFKEPFLSTLQAVPWGIYGGLVLEHPEKHLPLGAIVAVCELKDVVQVGEMSRTRETIGHHLGIPWPLWLDHERISQELAFGDYTPGRFMWLLSNVRALAQPIPARGRPGLFEVEIPGEEMERRGC